MIVSHLNHYSSVIKAVAARQFYRVLVSNITGDPLCLPRALCG